MKIDDCHKCNSKVMTSSSYKRNNAWGKIDEIQEVRCVQCKELLYGLVTAI